MQPAGQKFRVISSEFGSCLLVICAACRAEIYAILAYVNVSYVWLAGRRSRVISAQLSSCLPAIWTACRVETKTKSVSGVCMVPALLKCVAVLFCLLMVLYLPMHLPHCLGPSLQALSKKTDWRVIPTFVSMPQINSPGCQLTNKSVKHVDVSSAPSHTVDRDPPPTFFYSAGAWFFHLVSPAYSAF